MDVGGVPNAWIYGRSDVNVVSILNGGLFLYNFKAIKYVVDESMNIGGVYDRLARY
jgi:hypothetical protein